MVSYFVPISVLVLAGFALGLLVGRLAWASSTSAAGNEPTEPAGPDETHETGWAILRPSSRRSTHDLPTWTVRVVPDQPDGAGSLPVGIFPDQPTRAGPGVRQR